MASPSAANSRSVDDLHPALRKAWEGSRAEWAALYPNSPQPFLTQTYRSPLLQAAYYAQGRDTLERVNQIRANIRLPQLTAKENRIKVTNAKAGQSKHQRFPSEALDIAFTDIPGDGFNSIYPAPLFGLFAKLMKKRGVVWGGDFRKFSDPPHFEMPTQGL